MHYLKIKGLNEQTLAIIYVLYIMSLYVGENNAERAQNAAMNKSGKIHTPYIILLFDGIVILLYKYKYTELLFHFFFLSLATTIF